MSTVRYITISCDQCNRLISTQTDKLSKAETRARNSGWRKTKDLQHYCPSCKENRG